MSNTEEFIREFIRIYREHRALWQVKSKVYSDRRLKEIGYEKLLEYLKTVDENANIDSVKKKINNLRSSFRKEMKKIEISKKSGCSSDDVYTPTLWYFKLMLFTADQEEQRQTVTNDSDDSDDAREDSIQRDPLSNRSDDTEDSVERPMSVSLPSPPAQPESRSRKRKATDTAENLLRKVEKQLDVQEDDFDITGKHVANKLRNMPKNMAILAEKLIMDVLFEGQMENLNRNCTLSMGECYLPRGLTHPSHEKQFKNQPSTSFQPSPSLLPSPSFQPSTSFQPNTPSISPETQSQSLLRDVYSLDQSTYILPENVTNSSLKQYLSFKD